MAFKSTDILEVHIWGQKAGVLAPNENTPFFAFEYYPEFRASGVELAPLSMPLNTQRPVTEVNLPVDTYYRLPAFIADSLPDSFGNGLINTKLKSIGASLNDISALDRLAYVGKRAMGALEFYPPFNEGSVKPSVLELRDLVDEARLALGVNLNAAENKSVDAGLAQLISVGTSAGGARAKAVLGYKPKTGSFVSGQFGLPSGYEHWLLKFDVADPLLSQGAQPSGEHGRIEYAYYKMALDCGINMSPSALFELNGAAHFMTKRFDRGEDNTKIHTSTLCAMAELDFRQLASFDYKQLFLTAHELGLSRYDTDEIFRRMAFNVCMANNDDHSKNHSFMLRQGANWTLAPAYDITHACNPKSQWTSQHFLAVNGHYSAITRADLLKVGRNFLVAAPADIIDHTLEVAANWSSYAQQANISKQRTAQVGADILQCCALVAK